LHLGLLEVRVQLDLVDGGDDLGLVQQVREVLDLQRTWFSARSI
jgi:hypothetical protein